MLSALHRASRPRSGVSGVGVTKRPAIEAAASMICEDDDDDDDYKLIWCSCFILFLISYTEASAVW